MTFFLYPQLLYSPCKFTFPNHQLTEKIPHEWLPGCISYCTLDYNDGFWLLFYFLKILVPIPSPINTITMEIYNLFPFPVIVSSIEFFYFSMKGEFSHTQRCPGTIPGSVLGVTLDHHNWDPYTVQGAEPGYPVLVSCKTSTFIFTPILSFWSPLNS